jgi:hypothetical protein
MVEGNDEFKPHRTEGKKLSALSSPLHSAFSLKVKENITVILLDYFP